MKKYLTIFVLLVILTSIYATEPITQVPFTYVIDYTVLQAIKPEFRKKLYNGTPTLYHPGAWMRYLGRYGFGSMVADYRTNLYEIYEEQVRDYLQFMRKKGIRWVTPYLCNQTISGNLTLRTGAWEVYDHWADYTFLGLGPKPSDPIAWMQREPSGNLHYNYKRNCFLERHNDERQIRYTPCPNNQDWRNLMNVEARTAARIGFGGLFIDNNIIHCYCSSCEARFQEYLKKKYSPEELKKAFGTRNYREITLYKEGDLRYWARTFSEFVPWLEKKFPAEKRRIYFDTTGPLDEVNVDAAGGGMLTGETAAFIAEHVLPPEINPTFENVRLANPALQTPVGRLRWAETQLFWAYSIGEQLAELRAAGREVNSNFFLIPNWGVRQRVIGAAGRAEDGKNMRLWKTGAQWQMYEEGAAMGLVAPGVVLDYDMELRYAFACGVRGILLPYTESDPIMEEIHHAEAAASGSSIFGTVFRYPEVRAKYRRFFEEHSDLYEGYRSAANVALVHLFDQVHYLNIEHLTQIHALNRFLADQQIPFDHIIETDLNIKRLSKYKVLILPNIVFMSDEQVTAIQHFIDNDGIVILIGKNATHDLYCKSRSKSKVFTPSKEHPENLVSYQSLELALPYRGLYLEQAFQAHYGSIFMKAFEGKREGKYLFLAELDRKFRFKRYQKPGPLTEVISSGLGASPNLMDPIKASGVRNTVWIKEEGGNKRIMIHLVNKNLPLVSEEGKRVLKPIEELKLTLPCSQNEKVKAVRGWQPGRASMAIKTAKVKDERLEMVIPRLEAYLVVDIILGF